MTGKQIAAVLISALLIWGAVSITKVALDGREKRFQLEMENRRLEIQANMAIDIISRMKGEFLESLKEIGGENSISINGVDMPHESLVERTKEAE